MRNVLIYNPPSWADEDMTHCVTLEVLYKNFTTCLKILLEIVWSVNVSALSKKMGLSLKVVDFHHPYNNAPKLWPCEDSWPWIRYGKYCLRPRTPYIDMSIWMTSNVHNIQIKFLTHVDNMFLYPTITTI